MKKEYYITVKENKEGRDIIGVLADRIEHDKRFNLVFVYLGGNVVFHYSTIYQQLKYRFKSDKCTFFDIYNKEVK